MLKVRASFYQGLVISHRLDVLSFVFRLSSFRHRVGILRTEDSIEAFIPLTSR
jgi:hypothetical protein